MLTMRGWGGTCGGTSFRMLGSAGQPDLPHEVVLALTVLSGARVVAARRRSFTLGSREQT